MTVDEAMTAYTNAVAARQQAEATVIAASTALRDANAQVEVCRINEEVALSNLGGAVGIPSEKIVISAQCKAVLEEAKNGK